MLWRWAPRRWRTASASPSTWTHGERSSSRSTGKRRPGGAIRPGGTYLLLLRLDAPVELTVGRLGTFALPAGWYIYVGSALGGLVARLRRHARRDKPLHWHVDALREVADLVAIAVRVSPERLECATAAAVAQLPAASLPAPRFGASDCRCRSHLIHFSVEPELRLDPQWLVVRPFPARLDESAVSRS